METFRIKPEIVFGAGALAALERLEGQRVLVVTDSFLAQSGLLERVLSHLKGCAVERFTQVKPDPPLALVAQGARQLAQFKPQAVIAFGGGSPMDCAKAMVEFGKKLGAPEEIHLVAIPTTAGTGSEVTSFAVLTDPERNAKYPLVDDALLPQLAILDPALLGGVPPAITADTGMDVLAHAAEAYVAKGASVYTDALAEKAFALAYANLPLAYQTKGECPAKGNMLLASNLAGLAFNAAGLGLCHSLAHALGGRYHVPHGRLNALILPHVIRFNAVQEQAATKYSRLAQLCGLAPNPRALSSGLNRLRSRLGMPEGLSGCGVEAAALRADAPAVAQTALADRCTPSNPRSAGAAELEGLLRELV